MANRSNQFQAVVSFIAKQLAPLGATVRESVDIEESGTSVRREVDTLIEIDTGLTPVRVAVECRDRGRRATIQWIDELIGKYTLTPVDKVLAISAAGYSKAAELKAQRHNIDILTLRKVAETDWPAKFDKLSIVRAVPSFSVGRAIRIATEPEFHGEARASDRVQLREPGGQVFTTSLNDFGNAAQLYALDRTTKQLAENSLSILKGHRLDEPLIFSVKLPLTDHRVFLLHGKSKYRVIEVLVDLKVDHEITSLPAEYRSLGESALLTTLQTALYSLMAVQVEGSEKPEVFFETAGPRRHAPPKRATRKARRGVE